MFGDACHLWQVFPLKKHHDSAGAAYGELLLLMLMLLCRSCLWSWT
jgi:hypothetical protein